MNAHKNTLNDVAYYAAFKAHDSRFDGRIFVGVSSTGIYCRPICRVKTPKLENCSFYSSAACAEAAGFRPCLKCRPELAPGNSPMDGPSRLARKTALALEEERFSTFHLSDLAESFGVSDRHLRRTFAAEYGVSPVRYLQTRRLLLAKSLLTDTRLSITDVAMAAGFGSIRRFNTVFRNHYRLSPRDLRTLDKKTSSEDTDGITLLLGYRPPYAWNLLLSFLADKAVPGVESVNTESYCHTAAVKNGRDTIRGWIRVRQAPERNALAATIAPQLVPVVSKVLVGIRALFDVDCEPWELYDKIVSLNDYLPGAVVRGIRVPGCFDPFAMSVQAILGRSTTAKANHILIQRFVLAFGTCLTTPIQKLTHTFPTYSEIACRERSLKEQLGSIGITGDKAHAVAALATALASGRLTLARHANVDEVREKLCALPGFDPETAQYITMRALSWPDAFPCNDKGMQNVLTGLPPDKLVALTESWRPWRAYAAMALRHALENRTRTKGVEHDI